MPIKVTMRFQLVTITSTDAAEQRIATWGESHWLPIEDLAVASAAVLGGLPNAAGILMQPLLTARALLLPDEVNLFGFKLQKYDVGAAGELPSGNFEFVARLMRNSKSITCDTPQHACLCSAGLVAQPRQIRFAFRAVPDVFTDGGALSFSKDYRAAVREYLQVLANGYGTIVDQRVGVNFQPQSIAAITAGGEISLNNPLVGIAVGNMVKVTQSTRSTTGRRTGGVYRVTAFDGPLRTVTVDGWDKGACSGGKLRNFARVYAAYDSTQIDYQRASNRKVGSVRSYRGRNTPRR